MSRPLRLQFAGALYHVTSRAKPFIVSTGSGLALCILRKVNYS
ncbi:hypothetical protein [Pseudoalteromonas xiamenensis]